MRFSAGTSGMPFGTAHETATPSRSRRRSQWSRVALCSWTTKRLPPDSALSGAGSGEASKSRLRRYSFSCSVVFLEFFVRVAICRAAGLVLTLLGEAILERGRVLAVLGVLDEQLLRLLEAFLLAAAGLVYGLPRGVVGAFLGCLHEADPTLPPAPATRHVAPARTLR